MKNNAITIRPSKAADAALLLDFIRKLAEYEREPQSAVATEADLLRDGFGANPKFWALIAELDGKPAGFAFYFYTYSTWSGRPGIFLEDLFVHPEMRKRGIGKALMAELARIALRNNCHGMRWQVLDWNKLAIQTYETMGAEFMKEWLTMRITGETLRKLAESA